MRMPLGLCRQTWHLRSGSAARGGPQLGITGGFRTPEQNPLLSACTRCSKRKWPLAGPWQLHSDNPHPGDKHGGSLCVREAQIYQTDSDLKDLLPHCSASDPLALSLWNFWAGSLHLEGTSDETDGKCQRLLLIKSCTDCRAVLGGYGERGWEADRRRQLSKWLFVAPRVLCFGEIINCIIRTPVIHKLFAAATDWL